MSLFSGGKSKDSDLFSKKCQFYVEFLGWMESRGVRGHRYTEAVMKELRRRQKNTVATPKLTIEVSRKELKITQSLPDKSKKGVKKVKFPTIPTRDVTYVQQAIRPGDGRLDDTVACIYLGYMPRTQRYVHVHVYRFDEAKTAALFATQMAALVEDNYDRIQKVEIDLAKRGEIDHPRMMPSGSQSEARTTDSAVGSASSTGSNDESSIFGNEDIDPDLQSLRDVQPFDSVADELKYRLQMTDKPLLLPPKDYDTVRRGHGNLKEVNRRRCLNLNIVGENALLLENKGSKESGVDLLTPVSDPGEVDDKIILGKTQWRPLEETTEDHSRDPPVVASQHNPKAMSHILHKFPKHNVIKPTPEESSSPDAVEFKEGSSKSRGSVGNKSPEISQSFAEIVYPPKVTSPDIYRRPHKIVLTPQSSIDSSHPYYLHENRQVSHYRSDSGNDIYSVPQRVPMKLHKQMSLDEELQPGYRNEFNEHLRRQELSQQYRRSNLPRAMSEDYSATEAKFGINPRPNDKEFPGRNRNSSPSVLAPHYGERGGISSQSSSLLGKKIYFGKRK